MTMTLHQEYEAKQLLKVISAARRCVLTPMTDVPLTAPICRAILSLAFALTDAGYIDPMAWPPSDSGAEKPTKPRRKPRKGK